jgi:hypothetical protein
MRTAAKSKTRNRGPVSLSASIPAPVGGWNARDSLAEMPAGDAVSLVNYFPATTECVLRFGYSEHATGLPGQVETLMEYAGGNASELWAIAGGGVYDVTSPGAVGAAAVSGLSNSRWQCANFANGSGSNWLIMANGADNPYSYDGSTWGNPAITGPTASNLNNPIVFKNRLWFIERNTLKAHYLPTLAIAGAASPVDMSGVAQLGGYLVAHATWTIDAGTGVDDYYVAVTSKGEVIVYQGTDPASADTWALKGVWRIGAPVGSRCLTKLGGDLLIICQDGVLPLSAALQSSRVNPRVALTDKIQSAISQAVTSYGATFGWEAFYFPGENQLWINVPVSVGSQEQYVMNTITRNWGQYQGWAANTFCLFQDQPYFGGNGVVCKAWDTNSDNGVNINGAGLQAFQHFGAPGNVKRFTMIRPILRTTGTPSLGGSMNIDFDTTSNTSSLSFSPVAAATWDSATWDSGIWSGLQVLQSWQGVSGVGYYAAPQLRASANGIEVRWVSTDVVFERGSIL